MSRHIKKTQHPNRISENVQNTGQAIAEAGEDFYNSALEQSKAAGKNIDAYVHKNVWTSLGIAAGLGILIGILLRRH